MRVQSQILAFVLASILVQQMPAAELVGTLPGDVSVDLLGRATYPIEIKLPPGTGGMVPTLSLNYSSQSPNGVMGIGWSVGGLSSISRSGKNYFYDETISGVTLSNNTDCFDLDGQRLIRVAGTGHGSAGAIYHTAVETFTQITLVDTIAGSTSPRSFLTKTKSGLIAEYGNTNDSRVELSVGSQSQAVNWLVNKMTDTAGNYITLAYTKDNNVAYIDTIDYTGNTAMGLTPYMRVKFEYETRSDYNTRYLQGYVVSMQKRLKRILIKELISGAEGNTLYKYEINYESSPSTSRSRVATIAYSVTNGASYDTVPATQFVYQNREQGGSYFSQVDLSGGVVESGTSVQIDPSQSYYNYYADEYLMPVYGDVDGDGRPEIIHLSVQDISLSEKKIVADVFKIDPLDNSVTILNSSDILFINNYFHFIDIQYSSGDFDGDGISDIYIKAIARKGAGRTVEAFLDKAAIFKFNPSSNCFSVVSSSLIEHTYNIMAWIAKYGQQEHTIYVVDIDNDGIDEVFELKYDNDNHGLKVLYIADPLLAPASETPYQLYFGQSTYGFAFQDMNGDGVLDIVQDSRCEDPDGSQIEVYYWPIYLMTGSVPNGISIDNANREMLRIDTGEGNYINLFSHDSSGHNYYSDINGDGYIDLVKICKKYNPDRKYVYVYLNTNKIVDGEPVFKLAQEGSFGNYWDVYHFIIGDITGDTYPELIMALKDDNNIKISYWLGTGSGFDLGTNYTITTTDPWNDQGLSMSPIDYNGDGLNDLMTVYPRQQNNSGNWWYRATISLYKSNGVLPDYLTSTTNGIGVQTKINYASIADPAANVYDRGAQAPEDDPFTRIMQMPMQVVSQVHKDTGLVTIVTGLPEFRTFDYYYAEARVHTRGLGFLGFDQFASVDHYTKMYQLQQVEQRPPCNGMVRETTNYHLKYTDQPKETSLRVLLTSTTNTNIWDVVAGGTRFPMTTKSVEKRYEWYNVDSPPSTHDAFATITINNWFDNQPINATPIVEWPSTSSPPPGHITSGNLVQTSTSTSDGHSKTTTSEYAYDDTTKWFLGRLSKTTVVSTAPGVPSETRVSEFHYHNTTGLLSDEIEEPFSGSAYPKAEYKKTWYVRDGYGNATEKWLEYYDYDNSNTSGNLNTTVTQTAVERVVYDSTDKGRSPRYVYNSLDQAEINYYDYKLGVATQKTGPNGTSTYYTYDGLGRLLTQKNPDGTSISNTYSGVPTSAPVAVYGRNTFDDPEVYRYYDYIRYQVTTQATMAPTVVVSYDKLGREALVQGERADGKPVCKETVFDQLGRAFAVSEKYTIISPGVTEPATKLWTTTAYDLIGRMQWVVAPDGVDTYFAYDGLTKYSIANYIDGTPGPTSKEDQVSSVTTDVMGNQSATWDNGGNWLSKTYHANGSVQTATVPGDMTTTLTYDQRGNKNQMIDPSMGTWTYKYNALGQLRWQRDAKNQITRLNYDQLGRMTSRVEHDGRVSTWEYYDSATTHGWIGALKAERTQAPGTASGVYDTERLNYYDSLGRPLLNLAYADNLWFYTYTRYDRYARVKRIDYFWRPEVITDPNSPLWHSFGVFYAYNSRSVMTKVTDSTGYQWWSVDESDVDQEDRMKAYTYGNGMRTSVVYNLNHQVSEINTMLDGVTQKLAAQAQYDPVGNVYQRITTRNDTNTVSNETYTYDNLNRLLGSTTVLNGVAQNQLNIALNYDSLGKISTKTNYLGNQSKTLSYTYDPGKPYQVTNVTAPGINYSYGYDANGNVTSRGVNGAVDWMAFNKPKMISQGTAFSLFKYDAGNDEILQISHDGTSSGPRKKLYIGGSFEQQYEASGVTDPINSVLNDGWKSWAWKLKYTRIYIATPAGTIATMTHDADAVLPGLNLKREYFHSDMLGSLLAISDAAGVITQHLSYDAWGMKRDPLTLIPIADGNWSPVMGHTTGYTGHEQLDHLDLIHMGGRIYDPLIGRFLSADPFLQFPENIQSFNRYSYVLNNPLTHNDPSGHFIPLIVAIIAKCAFDATLLHMAIAMFVAGAAQAAIMGAKGGDILKAGLICAATAVVAAGVGSLFGEVGTAGGGLMEMSNVTAQELCRAAAHGLTGGIFSQISGGDFSSGFLAGAAGSLAGWGMASKGGVSLFGKAGDKNLGNIIKRTSVAAIVGGTTAELGGGKFANGAMTTAVQHLFNGERHGTEKLKDLKLVSESRSLTGGEIGMAKSIYGESIDYSKVVVHKGKFSSAQGDYTGVTPNGEMYYPEKVYLKDFSAGSLSVQHFFIHEMAHVWQYQNGVSVFWRGINFFNRTYSYSLDTKVWSDFNIEQQASIIADYFGTTKGVAPTQWGDAAKDYTIKDYKAIIPFAK